MHPLLLAILALLAPLTTAHRQTHLNHHNLHTPRSSSSNNTGPGDWCLTFYTEPHCTDSSAFYWQCDAMHNLACMQLDYGPQSVYFNFSQNWGDGVGEIFPLREETTCAHPGYLLTECNAPSGSGCLEVNKQFQTYIFTGGATEGSCPTPGGSGPSDGGI